MFDQENDGNVSEGAYTELTTSVCSVDIRARAADGPDQYPACGPMSRRADMVCGANRTYTAKPVGVAEP